MFACTSNDNCDTKYYVYYIFAGFDDFNHSDCLQTIIWLFVKNVMWFKFWFAYFWLPVMPKICKTENRWSSFILYLTIINIGIFVLNKQHADSRSVCTAESTFRSTVINTESSKLTHGTFQNLTLVFDWFSQSAI